jgi:DNA polymerase/3'-5' exonuclease PolX
MKYDDALPIAEKLVDLFQPGCKRIEIAGSIRRLKPDPSDIEIVATPDLRVATRPLFGIPYQSTQLKMILSSLELGDDDNIKLHRCLGGDKYQKYWVSVDSGRTWCIKLDLFLVTPPADWGIIYLIRTGPADFSHWIVTPRSVGGGMPDCYHLQDGRIMDLANKNYISCPEEIDFLFFSGLDWIEPKDRHPIWRLSARNSTLQPIPQRAKS